MKALFAKVTNIKSFPSTGMVRVEIEAPVEQFPAIVALLHNREVLVTIAPPKVAPMYGVIEPAAEDHDQGGKPEQVGDSSDGHLGARCKWAVMRCKDLVFQEWIIDEFRSIWETGGAADAALSDERLARWLILQVCGVEPRKQLDTDPAAANIFDDKIRRPFAQEHGEHR